MSIVIESANDQELIPRIAELREVVWREWPFLMDRSAASQYRDLKSDLARQRGVMLVAREDRSIVGFCAGRPLSSALGRMPGLFAPHVKKVDATFYCTETVVLPSHRDGGLGEKLLVARDDAARAHGFDQSVMMILERPDNHPLRPQNIKTLDATLRRLGYQKIQSAKLMTYWPDVGVERSALDNKSLQGWLKDLK